MSMDLSLLIFTIAALAVIIITTFICRRWEDKTTKDPYELLKDFNQLIIYIATKCQEAIDINDCNSEEEYRDKLAGLVAEELGQELLKGDFKSLTKYLDYESVKSAVLKIFILYKGELNISEMYSNLKNNGIVSNADSDTIEEKVDENLPNGKTDITSDISNAMDI